MQKNMGNLDRTVRVVVALIMGVLIGTGVVTGTLGYVLLAFSAVFVLTSLVSFCPLYTVLGINTCPKK